MSKISKKIINRCVIKIGSALLAKAGQGVDTEAISNWVQQMHQAREQGVEILLVTSGSVAVGMHRMGLSERPHALHDLQALAAIGQMGLIQTYESAFQKHGLHTAQVLLTHDDLSNRERYLNARSTLFGLLSMGVVPVINENDTVATEEIRFGDNDNLAALVANLVEADALIILTDQSGLYDKNPQTNPDAKLVSQGKAGDPALTTMAGDSGEFGRGGMVTKLKAAQQAALSGAATVIAGGREPDVITDILANKPTGTYLHPQEDPLKARKYWLASHAKSNNRLVLDEGAVQALSKSGRSLLPVGVKAVEGDFSRGDAVACVSESGKEVARGLVNYSADEVRQIMGKASEDIESILGYVDESVLIHRNNMALV
jgi:glutamate 5-kinase